MTSEKPAGELHSTALAPEESSTSNSRLLTPTIFRGDATSPGVKTGADVPHSPEEAVIPRIPRHHPELAGTEHHSPVRSRPVAEVKNTGATTHSSQARSALYPNKQHRAPAYRNRPAKDIGDEGAHATHHVSPTEGQITNGSSPHKGLGKSPGSLGKNAHYTSYKLNLDKVLHSRPQSVPLTRQTSVGFGNPRGNRDVSRRSAQNSPGNRLRNPWRSPGKNLENFPRRFAPYNQLHSRPQSVPLTRQASVEFRSPHSDSPPVDSNTPSPLGQRYTGFPVVGAYIGAPGEIFSPRRSPGHAAQTVDPLLNQRSSPAVFSPPRPDSNEREATRNLQSERMTFLQVWALCGVTMATLTLPVAFFILSYIISNGAHFFPIPSAKSLTPSATFSLTPTDPFPGVPPSCLTPISIETNFTPTNSSYVRRSLPVRSRKIFCLFNISQLRRAGRPDITLTDMPLHYCGGIVYWSVGVANGVVRSRLPKLDSAIGVSPLKKLLERLSLVHTEVLVTVGGYPQESAHFSRLGADPGVMARFVTSLMTVVLGNGLNGAAIHWIHPEPGCGRPDDATTLSSMVSAIRYAYHSVGVRGDIAVILPPEASIAEPIVRLLADRVEWIFLETHLLEPFGNTADACNDLANRVTAIIGGLRAGPNEHKICTGYSLAPWLALGAYRAGRDPHIVNFSDVTSPHTGRKGTTSMLDICSGGSTCVAAPSGSCLVLGRVLLPGSTSSPAPLYVFHDHASLFTVFSHGSRVSDVNSTNRCAVIYDIESDNFKTPCTVLNVGVFAHLAHFADITERPGGASELQGANPC